MVPFVGRSRDCARLFAAWDRARAGETRHVLLRGQAGIGKTRLVDQLVGRARECGAVVLHGRCWDVGNAPAYWPWAQAFGAHLDEVGPDAMAPLIQLEPGLLRLMPQLRGRFAGPAGDDDAAFAAVQLRMFAGVLALLRRLCLDRPVLLVLDDLEAADIQSLELLRFVVRAPGRLPLMVVAVHRSPLPVGASALAPIESMAREATVDVFELQGLVLEEISSLLSAMTGQPLRAEDARSLHARTGGNPLFAIEFIRLHALAGAGTTIASSPLPSGVRDVIGQRLATLPPRCRELLATAAVLGLEVDLELLANLVGEPVPGWLVALGPALESGLLTASAGAPTSYRFCHPLVRESLYEELAPLERAQLHRRVADALVGPFGSAADEHLDAIASHYLAALPVGGAKQALEFCRRAARRASHLAAHDDAVRLLELALRSLPVGDDPRLHCEVMLELGDAQARAGRAEEARATLLTVAQRAERHGLSVCLARAALGFGGRFVWTRAAPCSPEVDLLRRALACLPADEVSLRVRLVARLSGLQRDRRAATTNAAACRAAVDLARAAKPGEAANALALGLSAMAVHEFAVGTTAGLQAIADELIAMARSDGDLEREMQGHHYRLLSLLDQGDTLGAEAELGVCFQLSRRLAQPAYGWFVAVFRAHLALFRGDLARAEQMSLDAWERGQTAHGPESRFCQVIQLYLVRREQGRLLEAVSIVDEAAAALPNFALLGCLRAHVRAELGRADEAAAFLHRQVQTGFADIQDSLHFRFMLALCAEMAARLGHRPAANQLSDLLEQVTQQSLTTPPAASAGSVLRYRGLVAATLGNTTEAVRCLRQAVRDNRAAGSPTWALRCALDLARVLGQTSAPAAEIVDLIDEVRREAQAGGFQALAAEAQSLRGEAPLAPDTPTVEQTRDPEFRREGETWAIGWNGCTLRLRDSKGLRYLGNLLAQPSREWAALELIGTGGCLVSAGDLGPALDSTARLALRRRLQDLTSELDEAERWNDPLRLSQLQRERDTLARELAAAVGLGGRGRRLGGVSERARQSVSKAIKCAIRRIASSHVALARHLDATIHTGHFCRYEPDPMRPPAWRVEL